LAVPAQPVRRAAPCANVSWAVSVVLAVQGWSVEMVVLAVPGGSLGLAALAAPGVQGSKT